MHIRCGNIHKCRNLSLHIVKHVHLDATFMLTELRPLGHGETKVYGGGVKGVDTTFNLKGSGNPNASLPCSIMNTA